MNKKVIGTSSVIAGILASVIAIEGGYVNFASRKNYSFFSAYVTKGTLIEYSNFHAYGLKRGGVRVSSYHIVSSKSKSKKESLCH